MQTQCENCGRTDLPIQQVIYFPGAIIEKWSGNMMFKRVYVNRRSVLYLCTNCNRFGSVGQIMRKHLLEGENYIYLESTLPFENLLAWQNPLLIEQSFGGLKYPPNRNAVLRFSWKKSIAGQWVKIYIDNVMEAVGHPKTDFHVEIPIAAGTHRVEINKYESFLLTAEPHHIYNVAGSFKFFSLSNVSLEFIPPTPTFRTVPAATTAQSLEKPVVQPYISLRGNNAAAVPLRKCAQCASEIPLDTRLCGRCGHEYSDEEVSQAKDIYGERVKETEQRYKAQQARQGQQGMTLGGIALSAIGGLTILLSLICLLITIVPIVTTTADDVATSVRFVVICITPLALLGVGMVVGGIRLLGKASKARLTANSSLK